MKQPTEFCSGPRCRPAWRRGSIRVVCALTLLASLLHASGGSCQAAESLEATRATIYSGYAARLEAFADELTANGATRDAERVCGWTPKRGPYEFTLFVLDDIGADNSIEVNSFQQRFQKLRNAQAEKLFALARQAADAKQPALAMQMLTETVRENPNHAESRRALGYVEREGRWVSGYTARMLNSGNVWRKEFGWVKQKDLPRYEAGQRRYFGRWISAEEDTKRRESIDQGWHVRTAYYDVRTNKSLAAGVELALRLERLRQIWSQVFAGYYQRPSEMAEVLAGKAKLRSAPSNANKYRVSYFRTRQEYNETLRRDQPQIGITLGIYLDRRRQVYFFAGDEQYDGTLYHESTHQLFYQSRRSVKNLGQNGNYWIVEGIAAFMESLTETEAIEGVRCYHLGGFQRGRMPAASFRLLDTKFYVPFAEITRMTTRDLQHHPEIAKLYSQATGQATFLMSYEGGRYRGALVDYLIAVYAGRTNNSSLAKLAGASYAELDKQYREFVLTGVAESEPNESESKN